MFAMRGYVRVGALLCVLSVMLVAAATADAASLRGTPLGYHFEAAPGEANDIEVTTEGRDLVIRDYGTLELDARRLPRECSTEHDAESIGVRCTSAGSLVLSANMGDGNDWFNGTFLHRRISLVVNTGDGSNVVEGGSGDDVLYGGDGNDTMYGDRGDDWLIGGDGNNWLRGNAGDDRMWGGNDFDFVFGDGGNDWVDGGAEDDYVYGGGGDDYVLGGLGNDLIEGNKGSDSLYGGAGDDELAGGKGKDIIDGGAGNDLLRARDNDADTLRCGSGTDIARVDARELDQARRDCETVKQADSEDADPVDAETEATDPTELTDGVGAGDGAAAAVAGSELVD